MNLHLSLTQHSLTQFLLFLVPMGGTMVLSLALGPVLRCFHPLLSLNCNKLGWGPYQVVLRMQALLPFSAQHLQVLSVFL